MTEPRTGTRAVEVEWQLDALDLRPVERWLAACGAVGSAEVLPGLRTFGERARRLLDVYVDTEDWRLGGAGYVLRVRRSGGRLEATLKDFSASNAGLRRRLEVTQSLGPAGLATMDREGEVGWRVQALAGSRPLRPVLEVRTRRRPYRLVVAGDRVGELCLDETAISALGERRRLHLARVEIEVEPDLVESMRPLVERLCSTCGLTPANLSKFEAGVMATGLRIPGPPELGPVDLDPGLSLGELAFRVLRRELSAMLAEVPGTRLGEDIEALHQMRVATRRLRAALEMFSGVMPVRAARLHAELGWLAAVLGEVRDLDVQAERLGRWCAETTPGHRPALEELSRLLALQHRAARAALLEALDSARYARLASGLTAMVVQGPSRRFPAGRVPAVVAVPAVIEQRHARAAKAARRARRTGLASDYHRLRIGCKRLRYALEFSSGLYGSELRGFIRELTRLQGTLGDMQDAQVASSRLEAAALGGDGSLTAGTVFAMGELAGRYRAEARRLTGELPPLLGALDNKRWRRVHSLLASRARRAAIASGHASPVASRRLGEAVPATGSPEAEAQVVAPAGEPTDRGADPGADLATPTVLRRLGPP